MGVMRFRFQITAALLLSTSFLGCGKPNSGASGHTGGRGASIKILPANPTGPLGTVRGKITLLDPAPPVTILANGDLCHTDPVKDESFIVGPDRGLGNVIVALKDVSAATAPGEPIVLDQIGCRYAPHVLAVQVGQKLRVRSSDHWPHNVHFMCTANPSINLGEHLNESNDVILQNPEEPFAVKCDIHPWMTAWVGVFDHPYYAVSSVDGTFAISRIPPGHYTLTAWHEVLAPMEQQIDIAGDSTTTANFDFHIK